jgi:hypothetical protein
MNWTAPVDIYCERTGPGLFAEPLNAVTNISFFIAAYLALTLARRAGKLDVPMRLLIGLTFAVGVGSTLFHTFAQRWAGAMDVIPILLFIVSYLCLALWRFFGARLAEALVIAIAFLFFASGVRRAAAAALPPAFDGATGYMPALLALLACGALLAARRRWSGAWLLGAGAVFSVSLTLRALDSQLCETMPIGTHYWWHILNGVVLGLLLVGYLKHGARERATPVAAAAASA